MESILTQTLIVHVIRTRKIPFIPGPGEPVMFFFTFLVMAIGVSLPYIPPLANLLGLVPLSGNLLGVDSRFPHSLLCAHALR